MVMVVHHMAKHISCLLTIQSRHETSRQMAKMAKMAKMANSNTDQHYPQQWAILNECK